MDNGLPILDIDYLWATPFDDSYNAVKIPCMTRRFSKCENPDLPQTGLKPLYLNRVRNLHIFMNI